MVPVAQAAAVAAPVPPSTSANGVIPEIAPGDYFVVKTPQGQALIDYVDLPFTTVSGNNVTIFGSLSSDSLTVSTSISAASAYITQIYVDGVSGLNTTGNYNTFDIRSGIIVDAGNTTSDYIISLSATTDTKLNAVSAAVPKIFTDSGIVYINASVAAPSFSEVCIGNNDVPQNLFIQPDDVNICFVSIPLQDYFKGTNIQWVVFESTLVPPTVMSTMLTTRSKDECSR